MGTLFSLLISTLAIMAAIHLMPSIEVQGTSAWGGALVTAIALAIVNTVVTPVMTLLSLPVTVLTLGLFTWVIDALALELASWLSVNVFGTGIRIASFGSALLASVLISLVSTVLAALLGVA